jgi:hypothetical protein
MPTISSSRIPGIRGATMPQTTLYSTRAPRGSARSFHDYVPVFADSALPNVAVFREQVAVFKQLLEKATPGDSQANDIDFLMAVGEIFTLVVYAQLLLENTAFYPIDPAFVNQIFDVLVRDFSRHAALLHGKPTSTPRAAGALPAHDPEARGGHRRQRAGGRSTPPLARPLRDEPPERREGPACGDSLTAWIGRLARSTTQLDAFSCACARNAISRGLRRRALIASPRLSLGSSSASRAPTAR